MYIDKDREIINSSTHNIPARLKMIDPGFFLVRNHATGEFEVHHKGNIGNTLELNIPFDELDERTIQFVRSRSIQYIDNIIAEMDRKNEAIEKAGDKKLKDLTETACKDIYRYCKAHESKETIDKDSKYFKELIGT